MLSTVKKIKTGRNPANREAVFCASCPQDILTTPKSLALAALVLAHQEFTSDASKARGFKREVVVLTHGKLSPPGILGSRTHPGSINLRKS
jgi:hypothetical protein